MRKKIKPTIGWREWVSLPDLGIEHIKSKIDTGARSSSLHAFDIEIFSRSDRDYVRFSVHPEQKNIDVTVTCEQPVVEFRKVKSSIGETESRPVIVTNLQLMNQIWPIELTLTNRIDMGFRMLLGRQSFRKKFLIDAGKSFLAEKSNQLPSDGSL